MPSHKTRVQTLLCLSLFAFGIIADSFGQTNDSKKRVGPKPTVPPQVAPQPAPAPASNDSDLSVKKYKLAVAPFTIGPGVGWTAASLDNKLAAAAKNGSIYFRKIPSNALMESRAQLQELNRVVDEASEPDFLLLNCTVEKVDAQRFEISATLASADRSSELAVITAFANASGNTAAELTAELWRKLDQPLEILRERPNLIGEWKDINLQQQISISLDEGVQLVANPREHWSKGESASVQAWTKRVNDAGLDQGYHMWGLFDGQWRRGMLEGRFSGSNSYFSPLIIATYQEDRQERRLNLSFPNGKSLVWRYLPPEVDSGHWKAPDGRTFKFVLGVDRMTGISVDPTSSPDLWNRVETFMRGNDLYVTYLRSDRILGRATGRLEWSRDNPGSSKMIIDNAEWKFSPLTY